MLVVEVPHDFDLLNETLFSIFLAVSCFLGERLDRVLGFVLEAFDKID